MEFVTRAKRAEQLANTANKAVEWRLRSRNVTLRRNPEDIDRFHVVPLLRLTTRSRLHRKIRSLQTARACPIKIFAPDISAVPLCLAINALHVILPYFFFHFSFPFSFPLICLQFTIEIDAQSRSRISAGLDPAVTEVWRENVKENTRRNKNFCTGKWEKFEFFGYEAKRGRAEDVDPRRHCSKK